MEDKLIKIQEDYLQKIKQATSLKELDEIFLELFGKNGQITIFPKGFSKLLKEELRTIAPLFNLTKQNLEKAVEEKRDKVKEEGYAKLVEEKVDLSSTEIKLGKGHLHPITKLTQETVKIFEKLGFSRFDAPEIDSDHYNFEVLNIPANHPARDLWDTLYINSKLLLRTHTSNSEIRMMEKVKPPFRLMNIGRCYRYENLDARHEHTFDQFELLYIDKGASMAHLQYLSEYLLKAIFGKEIKVRLRPKYYPFVEPGAGVDGECIFCKGKGCKVCGFTGWLELAGAGMSHPTVLKNGKIDPNIYSGIAWGFGLARIAMIKYGIDDIRLFNSGDLKIYESID
ncbi:MAG: phenylalanine--tRNA ligase subunit alpha [Candidatus Daviesbacteria bacterium]|nr:phenylalanine--tRNA ligase subunit alpha [Candidatus Daviesbacteria bacterium]